MPDGARATYTLSSPLPTGQLAFNLLRPIADDSPSGNRVDLATIFWISEKEDILAPHDVDPRLDGDADVGLRFVLLLYMEHTPQQALDPGSLLRRRGRAEADVVAVSHHASGGVDGDVLLLTSL